MPERNLAGVSAVFRRPFAEQVAFFRAKLGNLVPTARWDDIDRHMHDRGFMVAGAAKADLLADLAAAVDRSVTEGKTLEAFRKDFREIVSRNGWTGWTGEESAARQAWRTRVIYQTNANTAYSAGRYAQLDDFPFWIYHHGGSAEPRKQHLAWDGLTLPKDHAFWRTHGPPNDWGCSCYVTGARSERAARIAGGQPGKNLPAGWDKVDKKSGTPAGIGKGWDYRPGSTVDDAVRTMAAKTQQWEYTLAKSYMQSVPEGLRDDLAQAYRALPSVADDTRRYAQRIVNNWQDVLIQPYRTLGLATNSQILAIQAAKGIDAKGFDFAIDKDAVRHIQSSHGSAAVEARRGQRAVTPDDYARLPSLLNNTRDFRDAGESWRSRQPLLEVVHQVDGERWHMFFEARSGRRMLALDTWYIVRNNGQP